MTAFAMRLQSTSAKSCRLHITIMLNDGIWSVVFGPQPERRERPPVTETLPNKRLASHPNSKWQQLFHFICHDRHVLEPLLITSHCFYPQHFLYRDKSEKNKKRDLAVFFLSPNARSITTTVRSHREEEKNRDEEISDWRRSSRPNCKNARWHWRPGLLQNKNAQLIYLPGQTFRERAVTTRTDGRRAGDEGGETKDNWRDKSKRRRWRKWGGKMEKENHACTLYHKRH